jgi:hypothetical protein
MKIRKHSTAIEFGYGEIKISELIKFVNRAKKLKATHIEVHHSEDDCKTTIEAFYYKQATKKEIKDRADRHKKQMEANRLFLRDLISSRVLEDLNKSESVLFRNTITKAAKGK